MVQSVHSYLIYFLIIFVQSNSAHNTKCIPIQSASSMNKAYKADIYSVLKQNKQTVFLLFYHSTLSFFQHIMCYPQSICNHRYSGRNAP
jgi:hypothetical protein